MKNLVSGLSRSLRRSPKLAAHFSDEILVFHCRTTRNITAVAWAPANDLLWCSGMLDKVLTQPARTGEALWRRNGARGGAAATVSRSATARNAPLPKHGKYHCTLNEHCCNPLRASGRRAVMNVHECGVVTQFIPSIVSLASFSASILRDIASKCPPKCSYRSANFRQELGAQPEAPGRA